MNTGPHDCVPRKIGVGVHVGTFPIPSEAFIIEQARALREFKPLLFVRRQIADSGELRCREIPPGLGAWRRKGFALYPGVWAWGGRAAFGDVELIHAHFGPNGVYAQPIAKALGVPLVVTFHGFDATVRRSEFLRHGGVAGMRYVFGLSKLRRNAARFIAVSKFIHSKLLQMGFEEASIRQHYIGVDPTRFFPFEQQGRSLDVVCVGRLHTAKGTAVLIKAFSRIASRFPESRLRLVGGGPERHKFERLAAELRISNRVVFEGPRQQEEVARILRESAVSVLASTTGSNGSEEAFGLASVEAAASGLPSIVSRNGGLPETVEDGVTGIVVREGDVDCLADALSTLLSDISLRHKLGHAGRKRVIANFNLETQTRKLEEIYREVL